MLSHQPKQWRLGHWCVWGLLALICATYGLFALAVGLRLVESERIRALPLVFEIHALAGGVVLIAGIMQFNAAVRSRMIRAHRWTGRIYVIGVVLAGATAVTNVVFFDVGPAAKVSFALLGMAWLLATGTAFLMIRKRRIALHREWMVRSLSLTLFFVTFSIWVPVLAERGAESRVAYFIAVTLSWVLNLLIAEMWIRRTRPRPNRRG